MSADAENREEAVNQIKSEMGESEVKSHMEEKHPGEPVPSVNQFYSMVEQGVMPR